MPMQPRDMMDAVSVSLATRTGRNLEEWAELVEAAAHDGALDPLDQKAVRAWLKTEHGLPQNSQWTIADCVARRAGWEEPTVEGYTQAMYTGKKAPLRPLHDAVIAAALALGEAEAQGRSTYIPVVRHTQFVAVGPGTRGRLRIGFRFCNAVPEGPRLEPAKGFAQATHIIHAMPIDDAGAPIDPQALADSLLPLLRAAWEQN